MTAYLDRLRAEQRELETRCTKLEAFFTTEKFATLEPGAQSLLHEQKSAMDHYSQILTQRLEMEGSPEKQTELGEPVEIGGHDIDRSGDISFND